MLRFFHRPLLIAHLVEYEYKIKQQQLTTISYKIKRIIRDVIDENVKVKVWHSNIHTPHLSKNGFKATAIYLPEQEELLVIYRGSERDEISDWYYNYTGIVSGENTSQLDSALEFISYLKTQLINFDKIYKVAAGHSLGGHLAISQQLLTEVFQRVYTYNSALPQLKQLRKYDDNFVRAIADNFSQEASREIINLEKFASNYYVAKSHHIYNYIRENDFINSLNMTVGTFRVGKTIKFPAIFPIYIAPEDYLTQEDCEVLDEFLGGYYNHLLEKGIDTTNISENQELAGDEFLKYTNQKIKEPIQKSIKNWRTNERNENLRQSYIIFKALYNYMVYLAHSGLIPDDVLNGNGKEVTSLYEVAFDNENLKSLKNILKPLQDFYILIKAFVFLTRVKQFEDIKSWVEIAKAHDLPSMYDEL